MSADLVRCLGLGSRYTNGDKTWSVSPWTYGIQGEYSLYLQDKVLQKIRVMERRGILTADEAAYQKKEVPKDDDFIFGSAYVMESFQKSRENLAYLFWLQVSRGEKDFTLDLSRRYVEEDGERVVDAIAQANVDPGADDPNRKTPADQPGVQATSASSAPS